MEEKSIQFHYIHLPYRRDRSIFKYSLSNWILLARLYPAELFSFFFFLLDRTNIINVIVEKKTGERGIRTLDSFFTIPVFKTGAINHSAISPGDNFYSTPSDNT